MQLGKVNHIAIATADLDGASAFYRDTLGASVSAAQRLPDHGVTVVFVALGETKIELLAPLGQSSPIAKFLAQNPSGGIHHICYEVDDLDASIASLKTSGMRLLGDGLPRLGAHSKRVVFLHPKDAGGVLIELEEV